ncbi:MAG: type II toxin-antitoxin system Phd/YefM family antitoxin [Myxococcales bacterium]|nr:MAG: type II toxin-antitoxin system Phd/YefM family antitoxin [Myxococcales bacterium]
MNLKETVKPITYLKNNTAEVVREASENGRLMVVTQNGEAKAVVMGVEQYDEWKRTLTLLKLLAQGEADAKAGRVMDQTDAFRRAEAIVGRAAADE